MEPIRMPASRCAKNPYACACGPRYTKDKSQMLTFRIVLPIKLVPDCVKA